MKNKPEKILVREFPNTKESQSKLFVFEPETGNFQETENISGYDPKVGWFVRDEIFLIPGTKVVFFRDGVFSFIWIDGDKFCLNEAETRVFHKKGLLVSTLEVHSSHKEKIVRYITPWWRCLFDDGMFPEMQFHLEYVYQSFLKSSMESQD